MRRDTTLDQSFCRQYLIDDRKNCIRIRKKIKEQFATGKMTPLLSTALLFWCEIRIVGVKKIEQLRRFCALSPIVFFLHRFTIDDVIFKKVRITQ
ncbi:hypothetical protein CEXT_782591 [Caerostris extrusa]|uniref:Uncharacterized protein n=1 Tax=Caerostris extrusa TaxID=172846 RepID=A0AAV4QN31_CAEEX|nr:hypothetical protein CEXT_782591 [Caerostris extrusa]